MAAVCAGDQFGISPEKICDSIAGYVPDNNRSQVLQTAGTALSSTHIMQTPVA